MCCCGSVLYFSSVTVEWEEIRQNTIDWNGRDDWNDCDDWNCSDDWDGSADWQDNN